MNDFNLSDKVVVVTGAVGLIGTGFCRKIAEAGGKVVLVDVNEKDGVELEKEINETFHRQAAMFRNTDITDLNSIEKMTKSVLNEFGYWGTLVP